MNLKCNTNDKLKKNIYLSSSANYLILFLKSILDIPFSDK